MNGQSFQNLLRQCMDDCASLMGLSSEEASMATKEVRIGFPFLGGNLKYFFSKYLLSQI